MNATALGHAFQTAALSRCSCKGSMGSQDIILTCAYPILTHLCHPKQPCQFPNPASTLLVGRLSISYATAHEQTSVYVPVKSSLKFLFSYFSVFFSSLSHSYCGLTIAGPVQRSILFDLKDEIVPPTNETVTQVFARLSAYRDAMDGPQVTCIHVHHSFMHAPIMTVPLAEDPEYEIMLMLPLKVAQAHFTPSESFMHAFMYAPVDMCLLHRVKYV